MAKDCRKGTTCKRTCIDSRDTCRVPTLKPKTKKIITTLNTARKSAGGGGGRGGFSSAQQKAFDTITKEFDTLFNSPEAKKMFDKTAANYNNLDDSKMTANIRHGLTVNGKSYDKILDDARANNNLDGYEWRKVYNPAKNKINGLITKKLLDAKPC